MNKTNNQIETNKLNNEQKLLVVKKNRNEYFQKIESSPIKENKNSEVLLSLDEKCIKHSYVLNNAHKECSALPKLSMKTIIKQQNITSIKHLPGKCSEAKNDHEFTNTSVEEKSVSKPIGCLVRFIERVPTPHQQMEWDHCYTNNVSSQDTIEKKKNRVIKKMVDDPNEVNLTQSPQCNPPLPRQPYKMIVGQKHNCKNHDGMFELKHEKLVKIGDTFPSSKELITYLNRHAKEWLYYYHVYTSHVTSSQDIFLRCIFSKYIQSKYKPTGKRKRKAPHNYNCPCRIVMHRKGDDENFTVTHVCNHHDHELSEKAFLEMPGHSRRLSPELNEEIDDLLSLGVSTGAMRRYVESVTGINFKSNVFLNRKNRLEMRKVERQFSIQKLKRLTDIIKELEASDDKNSKSDEKPKANNDENEIFSTLSSRPVEDKPTRKKTKNATKKRNAPKAKPESAQLLEKIENYSKNKPSQSRKRSKKYVDDQNFHKKSRLETTLENLSYDKELLDSVRQLQKGYITQPPNDKASLIPTATNSYAVTTPNSGMLQEEHITNDRNEEHDIFSSEYFQENNDIHYDIMDTYHQSVIIDDNVQYEVIHEDIQTEVLDEDVQTEIIDEDVQTEVIDKDVQTEFIDGNVQTEFIGGNVQTEVIDEDVQTEFIDGNVQTEVIDEDEQTEFINGNVQTEFIAGNVQTEVIDEDVQTEFIVEDVQTEFIDEDVQTEFIDEDIQTEFIDEDVQTEIIVEDLQTEVIDQNVVYYENVETDNYIELHNNVSGYDYTSSNYTDQENNVQENNSVYSNEVVNFQSENVYSNLLHNITPINGYSDINALNQEMHQVNIKRARPNNNRKIYLENINTTDQTIIQAKKKVQRNQNIQIIDNQILQKFVPYVQLDKKHNVITINNDDSLKNENDLNPKQNSTQADVEHINRDAQTSDEITDKELIHNSRAIINDLKHLDNEIEYITKYNIDQYLIKENLHKHFEKIASTLSMSICNILSNIYNGKAIIEMDVKYIGSNKCVTMSYLPENVSLTKFKQEENNIVNEYRIELTAYYHALKAAHKKIHEEELEVKRLENQIRSLEDEVSIYNNKKAAFRCTQCSKNYEGKRQHTSTEKTIETELTENMKNTIRIDDETLSFLKLPSTSKVEIHRREREKLILKIFQQRAPESTNKINNEEPSNKKENAHEINNEMINFPNVEKEQSILKINLQENTKSIDKINNKNKTHENSLEMNTEVTNLQNVLSDITLKIQDLKREEKHLTLIIDELTDKSSTIIQECLKNINKFQSQYISINGSHVHKQKMFNFYLQELVLKNLIVIPILKNKVTDLQDEYDSLVTRNKALDVLVDRRKGEIKTFVEEQNIYLESWLKVNGQRTRANTKEYMLKLTETYIVHLRNLTQKVLELRNCIHDAEQEIFMLEQTRDNLKIEIDNLKKRKIRFVDRIHNANTIARLKCVQCKLKEYIDNHEDVLRCALEDLPPSKDITKNKVNEETDDLCKDPLRIDVIKIECDDDEDNVDATHDTSSETNQPMSNLLRILCRTFGTKNIDYRIVARKLKTDLLDEMIDNILYPN